MTSAELNHQLSEMQASLQYWQAKQAEALDVARRAQAQAAAAQRQLDIHQGHIERIEMWLKRLGDAGEGHAASNGEVAEGALEGGGGPRAIDSRGRDMLQSDSADTRR